jgi:hypothetical protein
MEFSDTDEAVMESQKNSRRRLLWTLGMVLGLGFSILHGEPGAFGYQKIVVRDGGMLTGTVKLKGGKPAPRAFDLVNYYDHIYCGRISNGNGWRLLREFTIGEDRGVKEVLIMLKGIERGKPFTFKESRIEAINCQFKPYVTIVRDQGKIEVVNMDPVEHDIQAFETSELEYWREMFIMPLPMNPSYPPKAREDAEYHKHLPGKPMSRLIQMTKAHGVFVMKCGIHEYMESWGLTVDSPYFALSDQSGRFEIDDIPPGDYKLVVWHPKARSVIEHDVHIPAKGVVSANVEIQPREDIRTGADEIENSRSGLENLKHKEIKPTLELQLE